MNKWQKLADEATIYKTLKALKNNGIEALVVENGKEVRKKVLEMLPEGAEVFTMTSQTAEVISLAKTINESKKYNSVRKKLMSILSHAQKLPKREKYCI